jgi:hypothetical protein
MIYMVNRRESYCDYGIVYASKSEQECKEYIEKAKKDAEYNIVPIELNTHYDLLHMWGLKEGDIQ